MDKPKPKKRPLSLITDKDVYEILRHCEKGFAGWRLRAQLSVMRCAGLRVTECCNLNVEDLDLTPENHSVIVQCGKYGKRRTSHLYLAAIPILEKYLQVRAAWIKSKNLKPTNALFITYSGRRLIRQEVGKMLEAVVKRAGITKRVHPHAFRHLCAVDMFRKGVSITSIRDQFGHANIATTDTYLRMIGASDLKKDIAKLDWSIGLEALTDGGRRKLGSI